MRKFRRILLDFVKMLIRSRPLFPIVCGGVFLSLSPIGRIGNKEYNIVVLDRERFWPGDLERLAEKNNLWEMSSRVRGLLHSLFFVGGELGVLRTGATTPEFDLKAERFKKYLGKLFVWLSSRRLAYPTQKHKDEWGRRKTWGTIVKPLFCYIGPQEGETPI